MILKKIFLVLTLFVLSLHASDEEEIRLLYYEKGKAIWSGGIFKSDLNLKNLSIKNLGHNCLVVTAIDPKESMLIYSGVYTTEALITPIFYDRTPEGCAIRETMKEWQPYRTYSCRAVFRKP